jgi:diaminohydroxyphosphoribosylaminopyrimidine deaminase/5-amino-6-(5-phosphoribosylamino)uracil reductase
MNATGTDLAMMRLCLRLARRGCGATSPNPMVGTVLVKKGKIIGRGWHRVAGGPHAEIEALRDAARRGHDPRGATLYVTLEPCSTHGRTPPCAKAIIAAGIKRVVAAATDPNPEHCGRGFTQLRKHGLQVTIGIEAAPATALNEAFNHWIVHRTPWVSVKAAMTLDGKIATASGDSKWITGEKARAFGLRMRCEMDAVLVGVNTVLADDPALTARVSGGAQSRVPHPKKRIILDARARTPVSAKVVTDQYKEFTTVVVSRSAPKSRVAALARRARVLQAPERRGKIDLRWLLRKLGAENVTSLLVEGGGEVNASFLLGGLAHRVAFFYAPKVLAGRDARRSVAGDGILEASAMPRLDDLVWRKLGPDLLLTARVAPPQPVSQH